jgi:Fe-S cluster assembly iron-binding protein IscA
MIRVRLLIAGSLTALAGCTSPSTPLITKPLPKPPIEVSPVARQVLQQIATEQKLGDDWWLRFDLAWRPDAQIEIVMVRERPAETDLVYDADGIRCVIPKELTAYLKNVRVEWIEEKPKGRFDVSFANQSSAEREAGRRWLREQEEQRKAAAKDSTSKSK